jgi:hypothetical protein
MTEVAKQLEVARQDEALRARSERDIEFAKFRE